MLKIDANQNIFVTRGDTLTLKLNLTKDGETYTPEQGDVIRFALSKGFLTDPNYELLLLKTVPNDTLTFTLQPAETQLPYGGYNYDLQITHSDTSVDTIVLAALTITNEVE